jgi:hypothetical protein
VGHTAGADNWVKTDIYWHYRKTNYDFSVVSCLASITVTIPIELHRISLLALGMSYSLTKQHNVENFPCLVSDLHKKLPALTEHTGAKSTIYITHSYRVFFSWKRSSGCSGSIHKVAAELYVKKKNISTMQPPCNFKVSIFNHLCCPVFQPAPMVYHPWYGRSYPYFDHKLSEFLDSVLPFKHVDWPSSRLYKHVDWPSSRLHKLHTMTQLRNNRGCEPRTVIDGTSCKL